MESSFPRIPACIISAQYIYGTGGKGVTTATHIRRHESSTTISTETVKTESKSSTTTKGVSITPPSIGILVFPDEEDEPLIGLSRPKALASYTEAKAKRDESFYRHGILAMIRDGKNGGLSAQTGRFFYHPPINS